MWRDGTNENVSAPSGCIETPNDADFKDSLPELSRTKAVLSPGIQDHNPTNLRGAKVTYSLSCVVSD